MTELRSSANANRFTAPHQGYFILMRDFIDNYGVIGFKVQVWKGAGGSGSVEISSRINFCLNNGCYQVQKKGICKEPCVEPVQCHIFSLI